jgi:hypothetical protein
VTTAWFAQREFGDTEILRRFQESLADEKRRGMMLSGGEEDRDLYLGMSLRELVREFRWQTLVLLKCCLLQPKVSCLVMGCRGCIADGTATDAFLWLAVRAAVHDAVFSNIFNTWPAAESAGQRRTGTEQLRKEAGQAYESAD